MKVPVRGALPGSASVLGSAVNVTLSVVTTKEWSHAAVLSLTVRRASGAGSSMW